MKIQKLKRRNNKSLILDMTPLIDVVFLLIIFFMVATTFQEIDSSINITLPASSSEDKIELKTIEIKIDKNLNTYLIIKGLDNKTTSSQVNKEELKPLLEEKLKVSEDKAVVISADKSVNYQSLIGILDIAKEAGAESLDLNTKSLD